MWQIMWILELLPELFWHVLLGAAVAGIVIATLIRFIPFVNQYRLPIQLVSVAVLLLCVFMEGGFTVEKKYAEKIKELKDQVAQVEQERDTANAKIKTKIVEKKVIIKQNVDRWNERIVEVEKKIDAECKVPQEAIEIINDAAKNRKSKDSK
jgi:uncharacterized protein YacL